VTLAGIAWLVQKAVAGAALLELTPVVQAIYGSVYIQMILWMNLGFKLLDSPLNAMPM
jgi:hypothetical protein